MAAPVRIPRPCLPRGSCRFPSPPPQIARAPISRSGLYPSHKAHLVSQARVNLRLRDVRALAAALNVNARELSRPLSIDEEAEWAFYRISARHTQHVWKRARTAWEHAGISMRQAAQIMCLDASDVARTVREEFSLNYIDAARSRTALIRPKLSDGPDFLLKHIGTEHRWGSRIVGPARSSKPGR